MKMEKNADSKAEKISKRKLRSSLKKSFRNTELNDSAEFSDETVGGLRRRVSFAVSNTVKPFVNDPVQNTIWDNTYEEIINHTDSNDVLSTAPAARGSKEVSFHVETVETLKNVNDPSGSRKRIMSKTITETVDMNFTCENRDATVNMTKYSSTDMEFTCVFPAQEEGNSNSNKNFPTEFFTDDDMMLTCVSPAEEEAISESKICGQTKYLDEALSLTCVFPSEMASDSSVKDMSLTCIVPNKMATESSKNDMSLTCIVPNKMATESSKNDMSLTCVFSSKMEGDSKDDSVAHICSIANDGNLLSNESHFSLLEGFSFKSEQQDILDGSKTASGLLHFSDGIGSAQKHSFLSNTSIYNTHQLLESRVFPDSDISGVKLMNNSADLMPMDKCLEPPIAPNTAEKRLRTYEQSPSMTAALQKCKKTVKRSKDVLNEVEGYLKDFAPTKFPVSELEKSVKRLSLVRTSSSLSSVSLNNESDDDVAMDEEEVIASKHEQIMKIFQNAPATSLTLISFQDSCYTFSAYFSKVNIAVETHPDDARVLDIKTNSLLDSLPEHPLFHIQNAFLVKHIISKMQMSDLQLFLGNQFDMLSLLDYFEIIMEKCLDFVCGFIKAKREFKTLKMDANGVLQFNIMHTYPPIFWTIKFQLGSPETILQKSLKVSSKWSTIDIKHFQSILINIQPGTGCIHQFAAAVFEYYKRTVLRKLEFAKNIK